MLIDFPRLPVGLAPREPLMEKLNQASRSKIVIISAESGCGKTMSALQWIQRNGLGGRYLRLDGSADSPAEFRRLIDAANAELTPDGVLVLDDAHMLTAPNLRIADKLQSLDRRILLLTRDEPPAELRELLSDGRATLLDTEALLFSAREIGDYFASRSYALADSEIAAVYGATGGGWAMGVHALTISGSFVLGHGDSRNLSAYFPKHIWDNWGKELRDFWLKTAVVPELTPELCFRLTGRSNSGALLSELSERNFFVLRTDENTYAYQSLFREFLSRKQPEHDIDADALRRTAAEYYMERSDLYSAWSASHAANYGAGIDAVSRELTLRVSKIEKPAEIADLLGIFVRSDDGKTSDFRACAGYYNYLIGLNPDGVAPDVRQAVGWNMPMPHRARKYGDESAERADLRHAGELYERSRLRDAGQLAEQALASLPCAARNDSETEHGTEIEHGTQHGMTVSAWLTRAAIAYAADDTEMFRESLDAAKSIGGTDADIAAVEMKYTLMDAKRADAERWLSFAPGTDSSPKFYSLYVHFATARAYIALNRADDALDLLDKLRALATLYERPLDSIEASALTAAVLWITGGKDTALAILRQAIETARPYGYVRVFADEGAALLPILKRLESENPDDAFISETRRLASMKRNRGVTRNLIRYGVKLTKRQILMIELLSQGLSQAEISEQTGIAVPTVKSHLYAAYTKLGVSSSKAAVSKARELEFIAN